MTDVLLAYVVNAVWQIPLVAIGAAAASRVGGLGPRGRHFLWIGALVLAVLLPALPAAEALVVAIQPATGPVAATAVMSAPPMAAAPPIGLSTIVIDAGVARIIACAFALAVLIGAARLVVAWRAATALARGSAEVALATAVAEALAATARSHGVAPPPVRLSEEVRGPVVVGHRAPVILAPRAFIRLTEDEQRAALLHELAHVVRRDFAVNLLCEAIALPGCWHPVLYEIKAGARRSREIACDALAAQAVGSRDAYARRLIALADALRLRDGGETSMAMVALISRGDLEERLMQLIKGPRPPTRLRLLAAAAVAGAVIAPAALLHVTPAAAEPVVVPVTQVATSAPAAPVAAIAPPAAPAPPTPPKRARR
ncbi:MAG: M56 family metallopeptidase, partial [Caulobacteraceae bacterium]